MKNYEKRDAPFDAHDGPKLHALSILEQSGAKLKLPNQPSLPLNSLFTACTSAR